MLAAVGWSLATTSWVALLFAGLLAVVLDLVLVLGLVPYDDAVAVLSNSAPWTIAPRPSGTTRAPMRAAIRSPSVLAGPASGQRS